MSDERWPELGRDVNADRRRLLGALPRALRPRALAGLAVAGTLLAGGALGAQPAFAEGDSFGGAASDDSFGGAASDDSFGGAASDDSFGGAASDDSFGGAASDDSFGGAASDDSFGGAASDDSFGGAASDDSFGGAASDDSFGGAASDDSFGGAASDDSFGGAASDDSFGGAASDDSFGGAASDDSFGGGEGDALTGGEGDDTLTGDAPGDLVDAAAEVATDVDVSVLGDMQTPETRVTMVSVGTDGEPEAEAAFHETEAEMNVQEAPAGLGAAFGGVMGDWAAKEAESDSDGVPMDWSGDEITSAYEPTGGNFALDGQGESPFGVVGDVVGLAVDAIGALVDGAASVLGLNGSTGSSWSSDPDDPRAVSDSLRLGGLGETAMAIVDGVLGLVGGLANVADAVVGGLVGAAVDGLSQLFGGPAAGASPEPDAEGEWPDAERQFEEGEWPDAERQFEEPERRNNDVIQAGLAPDWAETFHAEIDWQGAVAQVPAAASEDPTDLLQPPEAPSFLADPGDWDQVLDGLWPAIFAEALVVGWPALDDDAVPA